MIVEAAAKKAAIAWLDGRAAWCAWFDDALYVVSGSAGTGEQQLGDLTTPTVTLRGDHGGRIVSWPAVATRVEPGSAEWQSIVPQLAAKRLNASGGTDEVVARWARGCRVYALRPAEGEAVAGGVAGAVVAGDQLPDSSLAEPPRETMATRPARRPFRLHRVRRPPTSHDR